eukprot:2520779-Alexandrium_andersonii.AAC.1
MRCPVAGQCWRSWPAAGGRCSPGRADTPSPRPSQKLFNALPPEAKRYALWAADHLEEAMSGHAKQLLTPSLGGPQPP